MAQAVALALSVSAFAAQAATINVDSTSGVIDETCSLPAAIVSANDDMATGGCEAGSGADIIDLSAIAGETVTPANRFSINTDMDILGADVTINGRLGPGSNLGQIFYILPIGPIPQTPIKVNLDSLHLVNASTGVLFRNSIVTMNRCSVAQSRNCGISGGHSTFNLENSLLSGNGSDNDYCDGGLLLSVSTAYINNSTFSSNTAREGGGIEAVSSELHIVNTTMDSNSATRGGGVAALSGSTVSVLNSTIQYNMGGGMHFEDSEALISNVTIFGNTANSGGGVMNRDSTLAILNSQFEQNRADFSGGGVASSGGEFEIRDSLFSGNSAGERGGALGLGGKSSIFASTISSNSSDRFGGGIITESISTYLSISDSNISGNTAAERGGGIDHVGGQLVVSVSTISTNSSGTSGGGIHTSGDTELSVSDSSISGNTAANQGGGIFQNGSNLDIIASTITMNMATGSGGGLFLLAGSNRITDSTVSANTTEGNGGGVFSRADLDILASTFSDNTAAFRGGGLFAWQDTEQSSTNSTWSGNYAGFGGAALTVDIADVTFINNTITDSSSSDLNGDASIWLTDGGVFRPANNIIYNPGDKADCNSDPGDAGSLVGTNFNLVGNPGSCAFLGTDSVKGDPLLGPLEDNGGPTLTHLPLVGSPAINAGNNAVVPAGLSRDQRGSLYLRIDDGAVDLGAIENTAALPQEILTDGFEQP